MIQYEPPMTIRIELDHMKHVIIASITGEHMKGQIDEAVEKAIAEIEFDALVFRILHEELERAITRSIGEAVRANQELVIRCGEKVDHEMKRVMEQIKIPSPTPLGLRVYGKQLDHLAKIVKEVIVFLEARENYPKGSAECEGRAEMLREAIPEYLQ